MTFLLNLITAAVLYGTPLLYGTSGEILTEKSGNLNLGVEGMMFMGGALGLGAAFYYEKLAGAAVSAPLAVVIAIAASFLAGALAALLFSFLTITLRANQNVTGLALTIFGTGVGQYIGEFMRVREGTYVAVSNTLKGAFNGSPFPVFLQELPVVGRLLFSHSIFTYLGIAMAVAMGLYLHRSRSGLYLRAVGESPATADAAGISVTRCKYLATVIGGGISAIGGMVYIMTVVGGVWNHEGLSGVGWLAVALVIFCLWSPYRAIWGSILFGGLLILYLRMPIDLIPDQIYKILPYVVTVIVLVFTSMRNNRDKQPPASLGLAYFREERSAPDAHPPSRLLGAEGPAAGGTRRRRAGRGNSVPPAAEKERGPRGAAGPVGKQAAAGQFGPGVFPGGAVGLCFTGQERQKQRPRQRPGALLYAQITTRAGRLLLTSGLIEGKRIQ